LTQGANAGLLAQEGFVQAGFELSIDILKRAELVIKILKGSNYLAEKPRLREIRLTRLVYKYCAVNYGCSVGAFWK
jgi:hypothetical protein